MQTLGFRVEGLEFRVVDVGDWPEVNPPPQLKPLEFCRLNATHTPK